MKSFLLILTLVALLTTGTTAHAQFYDKPSHLALGLDLANPMANFANSQKLGGGVSAKLVMPLNEQTDLLLVGSGMVFPGKMVKLSNGKYKNTGYLNMINAMIGFRYAFTPTDVLYDDEPANTFYIEPRIGAAFLRSKDKALAYAPVIGYMVRDLWDFSLRYQATSSANPYNKTSLIAFSVAYNFSF